jgi:hypothetical protein
MMFQIIVKWLSVLCVVKINKHVNQLLITSMNEIKAGGKEK